MNAEIALGNSPKDVSANKIGYDIESHDAQTGRIRFIEVKGRRSGAPTITITRNEILTALNAPEHFILALVEVEDERVAKLRYVRQPFKREPDFGVTSVNYNVQQLVSMSEEPR